MDDVIKLWTKDIPNGETGLRDACGPMHEGPSDAYGDAFMATIGVMHAGRLLPAGTLLRYQDTVGSADTWIVMRLEWSDRDGRCDTYLCVRKGAQFRKVDADDILYFMYDETIPSDDIHSYGGIVVDHIRTFGSRKNKSYSIHFNGEPHLSQGTRICIFGCQHHPDIIWTITSRCNSAEDDTSYFAVQD